MSFKTLLALHDVTGARRPTGLTLLMTQCGR